MSNERSSLLVAVVAGDIDLEMFSQLRQKHPSVTVDNQVIEPSSQQIHNYKGTYLLRIISSLLFQPCLSESGRIKGLY